jgi:hypothetical protein
VIEKHKFCVPSGIVNLLIKMLENESNSERSKGVNSGKRNVRWIYTHDLKLNLDAKSDASQASRPKVPTHDVMPF